MRGVETSGDNTQPLAVDVPEAGRQFGVGTTTAWKLVRSGMLPSVRIGRRRLVLVSELERFAARLADGEDPNLT
jgi:excisionase family DNA binding protein